jgi:integrase
MFDRSGNRKYLNWPEREAFFRAVKNEADPLKRTFCLTLFYTGCRISEALNCTWERIDFSGQALVFETLKRRKRGHFRSVPIPPTLLRELGYLEIPAGSNSQIWPVSRVTAYRWTKAALTQAEIAGAKACPRGLRHSYAIACISRNVPLTVVKKWLGHARLETTAIYLDFIGEEERELAKRLWRTS